MNRRNRILGKWLNLELDVSNDIMIGKVLGVWTIDSYIIQNNMFSCIKDGNYLELDVVT